ncbi:MAG: hypothetical protein GY820_12410, partial [Gammaproteobacteria bacterium]|nr:hypothetical protein [Gammaproteobacteria bacterium]
MSNENSQAVNMHFDSLSRFFGNLTIYHGKTNVVQADSLSRCIGNYYPFGLTFNSFTRSYSSPQNFKFNGGSELNEITGNYETFYRNYDPVLGRFNSVDIKSELYASQTPYQFAGNNPIFYNDPLGDQYSSDREEWLSQDMNYGYYSGRGSNNSSRFGDSWGNDVRSVEGNLNVMGRSGFRDYYGISDGFGGTDVAKASDLARSVGLAEKNATVTLYSIGVNGMGDGNGNIISGTESYHLYADHFYSTGKPYSRTNTGSDFTDGLSIGLTGVGIYAGGSEFSLRNGGQWKGANGKWYSLKWGGNGATGARSTAVSGANIAKGIGKGVFVVGAGISAWQFKNNPTVDQGIQSGTDITMGAVGAYGGPIGWVASGAYFVDQFLRGVSPAYKSFQETQSRLNQQYGRSYLPCFVAGTLIYTEKGLKPIEGLKEGSRVYSYNFEIDSVELQTIEKFFTKEVQEVYEVKVGKEQINVTAEHPFYVQGKKWVKVKELKQGDQLKMSNGSTVEIFSISKSKTSTTVYNIEVAGNHNYYV